MKLFRKVMAAALLSTALSGAVVAADLDFGDSKTVSKAKVNLVQMQAALGLEKNKGGTAVVLTVNPNIVKGVLAADPNNIANAEAKKILAGYKGILSRVLQSAEDKDADKLIAALKTQKPEILKSKEFVFAKDNSTLGLPEDFIKSLERAVSPNPFAAIEGEDAYKQLQALKATGFDRKAGTSNASKYGTLKELIDALDAIEAKKKLLNKGDDPTAVLKEYTDLIDEAKKFTGGKGDAKLGTLATKFTGDVAYDKYERKKTALKKAIDDKKAKPEEVLGALVLNELVEATGNGDMGPLMATAAIKDLGLDESSFTLEELVKKNPADLAKAIVRAMLEMNNELIIVSADLRAERDKSASSGKGHSPATVHPDASALPQGVQDAIHNGLATYDQSTGTATLTDGTVIHQF